MDDPDTQLVGISFDRVGRARVGTPASPAVIQDPDQIRRRNATPAPALGIGADQRCVHSCDAPRTLLSLLSGSPRSVEGGDDKIVPTAAH
jgi:hypothetical protein